MIYEVFEKAAKLAPLGTFGVALTALYLGFNQLKTVRQNEAKKQYFSYLDECLKYSNLASGLYTSETKNQYLWFLHKTLVAHESIFQEFQNDREWLNSIRVNLEAHIVNLLKDSDGDVDILAEKLENEGFSKSYNQFIILIAKQTNFEPNNEGEEK